MHFLIWNMKMKLLLIFSLFLAACYPSNGINGSPGAPGTQITIVQFCPGTDQYPSQFNEIAFCIQNSLYAVYSANDGFLTYLPPGQYQSNAVGSSCNFIVQPNCVIINE